MAFIGLFSILFAVLAGAHAAAAGLLAAGALLRNSKTSGSRTAGFILRMLGIILACIVFAADVSVVFMLAFD